MIYDGELKLNFLQI